MCVGGGRDLTKASEGRGAEALPLFPSYQAGETGPVPQGAGNWWEGGMASEGRFFFFFNIYFFQGQAYVAEGAQSKKCNLLRGEKNKQIKPKPNEQQNPE